MPAKLTVNELPFNESQKEAVCWNEGPLLVLAGPGSGKTTVLTQRIIRLLKESPSERYRILALTFTQNAARHMRNKIDQEVSTGRERAYLTTFHSFCADIIRQHGELSGIKTDFSIMTMDLDREELLLEVIRERITFGEDFKDEDVRFLPIVNTLIEQCIILEDVPIPDTDSNKAKCLFYHYIAKMRLTGRIDYAGILYYAWVILGKKQVLKHYNIVYKYICVDEYQDSNIAQYNILTRLINKINPNLFVVADDDQIVYQWNGASPERLNQIISEYNLKIIQLPENYRCPSEVVNIANLLISNNRNRYHAKKPGISLNSLNHEETIRLKNFTDFDEEITWVANDIKLKARKPSDTKIMGRTRKVLEEAQAILIRNNIPAIIHQRRAEFESPPLRFLHSILRLLVSRADRVQIQRLSAAFYQIEGINVDVHIVLGTATLTNGDLLKAWVKLVTERDSLSSATLNFFSSISFDKELVNYRTFLKKSISWLDDIQSTGLQQSQNVFDNYETEKGIWSYLADDIHSATSSELTLSGFLQELDLRDKAEPVPIGSFELITIHGAKGLEFSHVYLIGMVNDILPSYNSIKRGARPESLEEERRSCYVAITRTQETLTMSYSSRFGSWQKHPSMFLKEMELI